jgi:hypothetical protein
MSATNYFRIASLKQIELVNELVNKINEIIAEAKASANYNEFSHLIERELSGVLICNDGTSTMVEIARKSGDKTLYSTTIGMLIRAKSKIQNIVDYYRN